MPRKPSKKKQDQLYKSASGVLVIIAVMLFMTIGSSVAKHHSDGQVSEVATESKRNSDQLYAPAQSSSLSPEDYPHGKGGHPPVSKAASSSSSPVEESSSATENKAESSSETPKIEQKADIASKIETLHSTVPEVPSGKSYVEVNNNVPLFTNQELENSTDAWELYGELDDLGRVTTAEAVLNTELMPAEGDKRESLSSVTPTGWVQNSYDNVSAGGWLYNRAHLIGYQLAGEQDNMHNLMTGTRYFNVDGMLPFENYVANYIEENEDVHVRYRITPLFVGDELLARGIFMEGYSIENDGELAFHVYVPNVQPGIEIDYATGENQAA